MKKMSIFLVALLVILMVSSVAFAKSGDPVGSSVFEGGTATLDSHITSAVSMFFGYIKAAGFIVGVFMLTWAGFKYLTAGAGKKAEAKETIIPVVIGAAIIILAPTLFEMVWNAFGG